MEILSARKPQKQVWHNKEKIKKDSESTSCRCVTPTVPTKMSEPQVKILSGKKQKRMLEQRSYITSRMIKNKNNEDVLHNEEEIKKKSEKSKAGAADEADHGVQYKDVSDSNNSLIAEPQVNILSGQKQKLTVEQRQYTKSRMIKNEHKEKEIKEKPKKSKAGVLYKVGDGFDTFWVGTLDICDSNALMNDVREEWVYLKETILRVWNSPE